MAFEHHFHHALHIAVDGLQRSDVYAEAAGDGRANLFGIERFALNLAAFQHVGRQRVEHGVLTQPEAEPFHVPDEPALPMA